MEYFELYSILNPFVNGVLSMVNRLWESQQIALRRALRQVRKHSELTQVQLSEKLAKPQSYVSKYETGERRLDYLEVKAICACCKMTIAEFDDFLASSSMPANLTAAGRRIGGGPGGRIDTTALNETLLGALTSGNVVGNDS